uniref:Uncharacterized protein n=1 Tax=Solanum lycopersicum TaxID=4081 RepID=A0A3Q7IXQ7_SOLLC
MLIQRLISEKMWSVHHSIATDVFKEDREEDLDEAWTNTVLQLPRYCEEISQKRSLQYYY